MSVHPSLVIKNSLARSRNVLTRAERVALLKSLLEERILVFDGAMGTELYRRGVFTNRSYDELCLSHPDLVRAVHQDYAKAGAEVSDNVRSGNHQRIQQAIHRRTP